MKSKYILLLFCFVICLACKETPKKEVQEETPVITTPEKILPSSTFVDIEGNAIELSDYTGKKLLLNFWATWCKPCIEEMPSMLKAQAALLDENYVFILASDQSMEKIVAFKEKKGFDFNFVKFYGAMSDFEVSALPATFIYNEEGTMVRRYDGLTEWDSPEILSQLKAIK